ncbi:hypothetical protein J3E69DRAFT_319958, partial [Trichoderma sp. SZMC 28015]
MRNRLLPVPGGLVVRDPLKTWFDSGSSMLQHHKWSWQGACVDSSAGPVTERMRSQVVSPYHPWMAIPSCRA